jgi:Cu/Zn superoxide dismutase
VLGAHVHVGPCVEGNGGAAGPHYNADPTIPPVVTDETEVWLDVVVGANGTASSEATVPFVIARGAAASVVIHADATSTGPQPPAGVAGARWACLPVLF